MPEVDVWQNLMSAHALNKQRLELRAGKGCASLSMPVVIQCDAVQYYQGWAGGGDKSFNVCNVHRFVTGDQGQQAGVHSPTLHTVMLQ